MLLSKFLFLVKCDLYLETKDSTTFLTAILINAQTIECIGISTPLNSFALELRISFFWLLFYFSWIRQWLFQVNWSLWNFSFFIDSDDMSITCSILIWQLMHIPTMWRKTSVQHFLVTILTSYPFHFAWRFILLILFHFSFMITHRSW